MALQKTVVYENRSGAWKAVQRALRLRQAVAADDLVQQAVVDLDLLLARSWPAAMQGNLAAADRCLGARSSSVCGWSSGSRGSWASTSVSELLTPPTRTWPVKVTTDT